MFNEAKTPDINSELTDAQLEQAAGGMKFIVIGEKYSVYGYDLEKFGIKSTTAEFTSCEGAEMDEFIMKLIRAGVPYKTKIVR